MSNLAICTIISKNYLPYARVLTESFRKYNEGEVFILLVDKVDGYFRPEDEKFKLIEVEELRGIVPEFEQLCFQYTQIELNTAMKPYLLEYLFKNFGLKKIIYFDPDILIINNLSPLSELLDKYSIVLTPHLTAPIEDKLLPGEIEILQAGTYNLGFIALANTSTTLTHLKWWQKRLHGQCIVAIRKGLFVDQKWMDLVPGFYDDVFILRKPGYNVAYWNFHCRNVRLDSGKIYVNDQPAYFFHFSGLNPENIKTISKHQNRFTLDKLKNIRLLFELYRDMLLANGWKETQNWPYAFDCFDNGAKIPSTARRIYLAMGDESKMFKNPFATKDQNCFFNLLYDNNDHQLYPTIQEGTLTELSRMLVEKDRQIQTLLNSRSWKITAPLRKIASFFKLSAVL